MEDVKCEEDSDFCVVDGRDVLGERESELTVLSFIFVLDREEFELVEGSTEAEVVRFLAAKFTPNSISPSPIPISACNPFPMFRFAASSFSSLDRPDPSAWSLPLVPSRVASSD